MADRFRSLGIPLLAVLLLSGLSLAGKLVNQFGFFVYPDSYYYLLLGENLLTRGHPTGTLGPGGMPFPPAGYAAMKVTYPSVVAIAMAFGAAPEQAGHIVAVAAAVLAVPLGYVATKRITDSTYAAAAAAAMFAASFGLTYWTGFVLSDSLSILLALGMLALICREADDEIGNAGDVLTGIVVVLLLLSRPTYAVALVPLVWLGARGHAWTAKRLATSAAAGLLLVSLVAVLWFPPSSYTLSIFVNLLPILALALVASIAAVVLVRRVGATRDDEGDAGSGEGGRMLLIVVLALASAFLVVYATDALYAAATDVHWYPGFARFAARDPVVLVALVPGAYVLVRRGRAEAAAALATAAVGLLVIYYWVEPRESRYLIHMLPFLVPLAAGVFSALERDFGLVRRPRGRFASGWRFAASLVAVALIAGVLTLAVGRQTYETFGQPRAKFLATSYPREVAEGLTSVVEEEDVVVTALPWPYYFHLRAPTWAAGALTADGPLDDIEPGEEVLVVSDASLRYHYPRIAATLESEFEDFVVSEFDVPVEYQYGYYVIPDDSTVRAYRLTDRGLETLATLLEKRQDHWIG